MKDDYIVELPIGLHCTFKSVVILLGISLLSSIARGSFWRDPEILSGNIWGAMLTCSA